MAGRPSRKKSAKTADPVQSGRRFLAGCVLPAFLLFCLVLICLYGTVWCVWLARAPESFPHRAFYPVHLLRVWSRHFYELSEKAYRAAGGELDPFERGNHYPVFRAAEKTDPFAQWIIYDSHAELVWPESMRKTEPFTDRDMFLRRFHRDGVFTEQRRLPALVTYRGASPVRIRMGRLPDGSFLFDSRWIRDRRSGNMIPLAGRVLDGSDRAVLYLAGHAVESSAFPVNGFLRGAEGFLNAAPSVRPLMLYEYTGDQEVLRDLLISGGKIREILHAKDTAFWPDGEALPPETLIRMAVRRSDLKLLNFLLHDADAIREMTAGRADGSFTSLHEAAMQEDPRILARLIPFFPDVYPKESGSGATPFLTAVMADRPDNALLFLRRQDRRPDDALPDGTSALHLAARNCSPSMVRLLLMQGADPRRKNAAGETPRDSFLKTVRAEGWESDPAAQEILSLLP